MLGETTIDCDCDDRIESALEPIEPVVLVAGDSAQAVGSIAVLLRTAGYRVTTASSCARIADQLDGSRRAPVGVLVLDGSERPWVAAALVAAIRDSGRDLPILLVLRDTSSHHGVERLGVREIFESPLRPDALRSAVARVLLAEPSSSDEAATATCTRRAPISH